MRIDSYMKTILATTLSFLLAFPAGLIAQSRPGTDPKILQGSIEGYAENMRASIRENKPLKETEDWTRKALDEIAAIRDADPVTAAQLGSLKTELQKDLADRRGQLAQLKERIRQETKDTDLESAHLTAERAPVGDPDFDELRRKLENKRTEALDWVKEGKRIAAYNNCNDRSQVQSKYAQALKINRQLNLSFYQATVPNACPPPSCGAKCKTTLFFLAAVGGGIGTVCGLDAQKGKSCKDRLSWLR